MAGSAHPIFIAGPSRSGTGLLRHSLNRHSEIWLTGETHYFDDLRQRMHEQAQSPLTPEDMAVCEDYFLGLAGGKYRSAGSATENPLSRDELRSEAAATGAGTDAYFEAFCRNRASRHGKERWGEKTPRHVFRIDEILARYPQAKVIAMIRDPRAVVVSYRDFHARPVSSEREALVAAERKRAQKSYHVLLATLLWRAAMRAGLRALERHGPNRVRLQRFEDLVSAPEDTLEKLTAWLGVPYEETMLEVNVVSSSHQLDKQEAGISSGPADRWRSKLSPAEVVVIERCAGKLMDELGYERASPRGFQLHHVLAAWLTLPAGAVRAALANRRYVGNLFGYVLTRLRFAASR